jgi:hypothetical protein|tara:strand:- start:349 stop:735 length:387 start_codon:yes stop_codon:yes gene_type:complete
MSVNKLPTNKNFGLTFSFVFLIVSVILVLKANNVSIIFFTLSIIFLLLGFANSKILLPLNKIWFKLGLLLGLIVAPMVMFLIFFLLITPIGFIMKNILSINLLNLKKNNNSKSYWVLKKNSSSMKDQF